MKNEEEQDEIWGKEKKQQLLKEIETEKESNKTGIYNESSIQTKARTLNQHNKSIK